MKILRDIMTFLSESERETNKAIKALMDHWSKEDDESLLKVQRHIVKASTAIGNADKKVYSRIRWLDAERPGWRAKFERQYRMASVQEKKAFMDATPEHREVVRYHLCEVLSCLRAQYLSYQTSHWQVVGGSFYGNHLLFERLYKTVQEQIDQLAEKIVGYLGRDAVDLTHQMEDIWDFTSAWSQIGCHHRRGLQSEADLQATLKLAYDTITSTGLMTLGLDDWLMATANSHEANQYLLQQALTPVPGQEYGKSAGRGWRTKPLAPLSGLPEGSAGAFKSLLESLTPEGLYERDLEEWKAATKIRYDDFDDFLSMLKADRPGSLLLGNVLHGILKGSDRSPLDRVMFDDLLMDLKSSRTRLGDSALLQMLDLALEATRKGYGKPTRPRKSASGAPTAEGDFYDNPEKKEVLEFANTGAISNSPEVAAAASKEDHLDVSETVAVEEAEEAPPTPTEIKEEPGGKTLSTLNRLVVDSEDPDAAEAAEDNKARMAAWLLEIES